MKRGDEYLKWVEWSDEGQIYIGWCPDLFFGGCHGDNPVQVCAELCEIAAETVLGLEADGKTLPPVKTRALAAA